MGDLTPHLLAIIASGLWIVVGLNDLRFRRVPRLSLLLLLLMSLIGRAWWWWLAAIAMILLPRRWVLTLAPISLSLGWLTNDFALGLAIALGAWAWTMNWWGGADAIVFAALSLRHGEAGLIGGLVALLFSALGLILKRRQSPLVLIAALNEVSQLQIGTERREPAQADLPVAAIMAVIGWAFEVLRLISA